MFGDTIDMKTKLASIEADLVSAHGQGTKNLHAEIFSKFAELVEEPDDIEAMLDVIFEEANPPKIAAGGFGSFGQQQQGAAGLSPDLMKLLSMGIMLAGPVMAAAKFLGNKSSHDQALQQLQMHAPQLFQQNPQRATALFEAVYQSAPNIAANTIIMSDLLHQLMAMPMVDMGTIARLTEMAKNVSSSGGQGNPMTGMVSGMSDKLLHQQLSSSMMPKKQASVMVPAKFKSAAGLPTVFNWASDAVKSAGLTDAFTGSGTNMEQANQATMMNQQESGNTMLPLDSVLHELLMKEMELQQREQVMAQQEQQLQQALAAVQHIGSQYQQEAGVDPNTGAPTEDPAAAAAPPEGGAEPAMEPAAGGAPEGDSSGEMPPEMGAEQPAAEGAEEAPPEAGAEEAAAGGPPSEEMTAEAPVDENAEQQMPADAAGGEEAPPAAEGEEAPPAEGEEAPPAAEGEEAPPAEGDGEEAPPADGEGEEAPPAEGEEAAPPSPQADPAGSAAVPLPNVDTSPEAVAAGEAGMADAASPMPPADQVEASETPAPGGDEGAEAAPVGATMDPFSSEYSEGASPMGEPIDNAAPVPDPQLIGGEEEAPPAAAADAGGGDTGGAVAGEGDVPAEGETPAAEEPIAEGEDSPEGEDDEEGEEGAEGPNTAESVEGSVEDEAKDKALGLEEGSPEDAAADEQLANELNAQGAEATPAGGEGEMGAGAPPEESIPPAMPEAAPEAAMAPPAPIAPPMSAPAAPMPPQSTPAAGGGHEIVLPLRITVKIGEADPIAAARVDAVEAFKAAMLNPLKSY